MSSDSQSRQRLVVTISPRPEASPLRFEPFTFADIPRLRPLLAMAPGRSCDFTLGGIYMWIEYFHYERAIVDDTLFIRGLSEDDVTVPAFSLPVGAMTLEESVAMLSEHCRLSGEHLRFSAVPAAVVPELEALGGVCGNRLDGWADYLYDAAALASLSGKKYNKKRNHVNRFISDNPGYSLTSLTLADIPGLLAFMDAHPLPPEKSVMAEYERMQTLEVLRNWAGYPFIGGVLRTSDSRVAAFTVGEIVGDTLHLHIEKADHAIAGAGEAINQMFAAAVLRRFPAVKTINRQDDAGDEGLRRAKLSYHPSGMVEKYNVDFDRLL